MQAAKVELQVPPPTARPRHVAIIMDGNGRWAEKRGLPRLAGHRQGAVVVREITTLARRLGLGYLTLYSFSRQNWQRSAAEVSGLMALLEEFCLAEVGTLMDNDVRLTTIGEVARLPATTGRALDRLARLTADNRAMTLCLAVDYGGREEVVRAAQRLAAAARAGSVAPEQIDEAAVAEQLSTRGMPDPDLLIRTSGEQRISNFLLWQLAYAELYFTPTRWPAFGAADFAAALRAYAARSRRFGTAGLVPAEPLTAACGALAGARRTPA